MNLLLYFISVFGISNEIIESIIKQTKFECNIPDYTIDLSRESIHSVIITPDIVTVNIIEDRKLKAIETIKFDNKNEVIRKLFKILIDYKSEKIDRTLIVCSPRDSLLTVLDLMVVFRKRYKQIIEGFKMLNAPKKFLETNAIGLILDTNLCIQYHKYEGTLLKLFMRRIERGDFIHKLICDFLIKDERTAFSTFELTSRILEVIPVFHFMLDYIHHYKSTGWETEKFVRINKNSLIFLNEDWPERSIVAHEDSCTIKEKDVILFAMVYRNREVCWKTLFNFVKGLKNVDESLLDTVVFLYQIVRHDESAFTFCILDILNSDRHFHYNALIYISFLLGFLDRKETSYFLERIELPQFILADTCPDFLLVKKIIGHKFKRNSTLSYFFMILITDKICRRVVEGDTKLMSRYGCFNFIKRLVDSLPYIKEDYDYGEVEVKFNRVFTLFWRIFHYKEVLIEAKENIIYVVLYAINRFILENEKFDFYSTNNMICTKEDELRLDRMFTKYKNE